MSHEFHLNFFLKAGYKEVNQQQQQNLLSTPKSFFVYVGFISSC